MQDVLVTRSAIFPDPLRIGRYKDNPGLGPRPLFFSGGTALNGVAAALKSYTHNSIHLVTPFDSGGSSQSLRKAFDMPAIGDLRSRLMALADESVLGHPDIFRLFTHRFAKDADGEGLEHELAAMVDGRHQLVKAIERPMRTLIVNQLGVFRDAMPAGFELRGASIGNLILAGGYLSQQNELDPIIFLVSKLVGVQGTVRAIVDGEHHLGADLADGRSVIGQHLLTGKEHTPITSPIVEFYLNASAFKRDPVSVKLSEQNRKLIQSADLICYPPGSFYTSLLANLLPQGVGRAIASRRVPKVFVPSLGLDPEARSMSVQQRVDELIRTLRSDTGANCVDADLLTIVMVDSALAENELDEGLLARSGVALARLPLVSDTSAPYYDPDLLCEALLSLT